MGNEDYGESSRKSDNNNDDERPLKKARYVWEVKGKYHLKSTHQNPDNANNETPKPANKDDKEKENESRYEDENLNNNLPLNNNNSDSCTNRCCIDSFLARSQALLESDDEDVERTVANLIPISLVSPNPHNQDYYLRKWQARQIAKGFMDNSINTVLESWMGSPFDATDLIEYCDNNDGFVEDEGILMAIQSHGLQSNRDGAYQNAVNSGPVEESPVSFLRPQAIVESTIDNFENVHNELIKSVMSSSSSSSTSSSSSNDAMSCESASNQNIDSSINMDVNNPTDFLNAAVSVAIQKKGLSSYSF